MYNLRHTLLVIGYTILIFTLIYVFGGYPKQNKYVDCMPQKLENKDD